LAYTLHSGKITNLSVSATSDAADSAKSATVTFEKESAAKTALLLDNTQLGPSQVQVTSASSLDDLASSAKDAAGVHDGDEHDISQDDKPRTRIVAEYLAHGYVLSDNALQQAIALDNKHGISARFTNALAAFDQKFKATDKAKGIDNTYKVTDKATTVWQGLQSYFDKAVDTPTGQKLVAFYTQGNKQVQDIHAEARRLADIKSGKQGNAGSYAENEKNMHTVPGSEKTKCTCGGASGVCPCEEGKCACAGCSKAKDPGHTATGDADKIAVTSAVQPLPEKSG
jgi:hypothetical protein